jgi:hypothetical protein
LPPRHFQLKKLDLGDNPLLVGTPAVFDNGVPQAAWIYEGAVPWDLA